MTSKRRATSWLALGAAMGAILLATACGEQKPAAPLTISLLPARPNPGDGSVTLAYVLPNADKIEFSVFDLAGRRVSMLFKGPQGAGTHQIVWEGNDASGRQVSSGTYVARLRVGDVTRHERVVVLR